MSPIKKSPGGNHFELTKKGFEALLDCAVDAIAITDSNGLVLNFNQAAQRLFGFEEDEVLTRNIKMLMPEPYRSEHDNYMHNYRSTGVPRIIGTGRHVTGQRKDSSTFPLFLSVGEYQEGDHQFFIGTMRDLSKEVEAEKLAKELQNRLSHADRVSVMGEMASGVAHELNQPLTAISSYVQACQRRLKSGSIDVEKVLDLLSKVEKQALRAGSVIDRIRALVKPQDLQRDRVFINQVVGNAIELALADATSRGVKLTADLMTTDQEVVVDGVQIQQVVLNLVRNAVDSIESAGETASDVRIVTRKGADARSIQVAVEDNGPGVSKEMLDRLFHPFVSSKARGTGLGLSISHSIVDAHGGKLWVEQNHPGAIFAFSIPTVTGDGN